VIQALRLMFLLMRGCLLRCMNRGLSTAEATTVPPYAPSRSTRHVSNVDLLLSERHGAKLTSFLRANVHVLPAAASSEIKGKMDTITYYARKHTYGELSRPHCLGVTQTTGLRPSKESPPFYVGYRLPMLSFLILKSPIPSSQASCSRSHLPERPIKG
jgi:hypothetical protein